MAWFACGFLAAAPEQLLLAIEADHPGKSLYQARCAYCHGQDGKGSGASAGLLNPKPRDFTTGVYRFRSTESGSLPADDDLLRTIKQGIPGTSMPAMAGRLKDREIADLASYIKTFSPRFAHEQSRTIRNDAPIPVSASSLAVGKKIYAKLECAGCHGTAGNGTDATLHDFVDENGLPLIPTDLTAPWTFHGGGTAWDVFLRLRCGIDGTPMPSYAGSATDMELKHLANYVVSLARQPLWKMNADEVRAFYSNLEARRQSHPVEWGRQLVSTLGCRDCHSPVTPAGELMSGLQLAGGQRWELAPFFSVLVTPNLTSDNATGLGGKTDEQIRNVLTKGIRSDGTRMLPFPMPWPAYSRLSENDQKAIIAYLRTVPPVVNRIPARETPNIISYLWGKFRMLILKRSDPAYVFFGNAGLPKEGAQ